VDTIHLVSHVNKALSLNPSGDQKPIGTEGRAFFYFWRINLRHMYDPRMGKGEAIGWAPFVPVTIAGRPAEFSGVGAYPLPPDTLDAIVEPPEGTGPSILMIDIETSPAIVPVWDIWNPHITPDSIIRDKEMMCFAAKWLGKDQVIFYSTYHHGKQHMMTALWNLLDRADAVMHYNGQSFDMPHINVGFITEGLPPPAPYKQIDLYSTVKKNFNFTSNKLGLVSKKLSLEGKLDSVGMSTWLLCMEDDDAAWQKMKEYNIQDVHALEDLYHPLRPWIHNHPSHALYSGRDDVCPNCGSDNLEKRGFARTHVSTYQRYNCKECGKWSRAAKRIGGTQVREAVL
jgi:hypothetical protein